MLQLPRPRSELLRLLMQGFWRESVVAPASAHRLRRVHFPGALLLRWLEVARAAAGGNALLYRAIAACLFAALFCARAGTAGPTLLGHVHITQGQPLQFTEPHFKGRDFERPRLLVLPWSRANAPLLEVILRFLQFRRLQGGTDNDQLFVLPGERPLLPSQEAKRLAPSRVCFCGIFSWICSVPLGFWQGMTLILTLMLKLAGFFPFPAFFVRNS
jgi:hypothetical protein